MSKSDKIKEIVKGKFGTNPFDPWSAKANLEESEKDSSWKNLYNALLCDKNKEIYQIDLCGIPVIISPKNKISPPQQRRRSPPI